ncbi:MAG: hypothetical protein ACLQBK_25975 [Candidatus Sulfotelmatobacter sp.]
MEESKNPINRPSYAWRIVSTVLLLAVAAGVSLHCYRYSMFEIDTLGYAGTVALADTGDVVKVHQILYSAPLTPHLRGLDDDGKQALDMRRRAADPYYAAMHFPYFAIKPLYILTLEAVHKLGFSAIDSTRAVSALFYFAIAVMLWTYTRSWLVLIVIILPETMLLGQANEPDGMSCFFLLFGLWMIFVRGRDMGVLPLLLAIWVRPENSLLCLLVILVLLFEGRLDWKKAAVLAVLSAGSEVVINHYGYPWQEIYSHFLGAAPGSGASSAFSNYGHSLMTAVNDLLHSSGPLFGLLWLVCFPLVRKELRWIMGCTLVFSAVRFMMFPIYELRYYGLFFITTLIAAVVLIQSLRYQDLLKKPIPSLQDLTSRLFRKAA